MPSRLNASADTDPEAVDAMPDALLRHRALVGRSLRKSLPKGDDIAYRLLRYAMGWVDEHGTPGQAMEGKALRPALCLLACEANGRSAESSIPAAVALELVHNSSLVHDDIQDQDEMRHHRPTVWTVWGAPKALVAGNLMRVVADRALWGLIELGFDYNVTARVTGLITRAYLEMIEGQYLDLHYEGRMDVGIEDYLDMVSKKTGALIRCSMHIGAILGSGDAKAVGAFQDCGRSIGYLFQVQDDMLGIWGDEGSTGKPVAADIRRRKNTLPAVYAMSRARGRERDTLFRIFGQETLNDDDVDNVLEVMESVGARSYAQDLAFRYRDAAIDSLSSVDLVPHALEDFTTICDFLLTRER